MQCKYFHFYMFENFLPSSSLPAPSAVKTIKETIKETTSGLFSTSYSLLPSDLKCWRFSTKMQNVCFYLLKISCHFLCNWVPITVVWWFENNGTNFSLRSKSHLIYLAYRVDIFPIGNLSFSSGHFVTKGADQIHWRKISTVFVTDDLESDNKLLGVSTPDFRAALNTKLTLISDFLLKQGRSILNGRWQQIFLEDRNRPWYDDEIMTMVHLFSAVTSWHIRWESK